MLFPLSALSGANGVQEAASSNLATPTSKRSIGFFQCFFSFFPEYADKSRRLNILNTIRFRSVQNGKKTQDSSAADEDHCRAFSDFLLCKKALGVSDKTLKTYSQHFSAICKYLDSSAPIGGLFKRPLEEMIEQMRSSNLKDTSINSYTRTLKSFLSWCNEEGLTETNISLPKNPQGRLFLPLPL